ncbi:MAG TPA: serine/threonine-protein kinase [Kofleriaceae bacterium]|nr:serine/threonine-protein kinase [Kofleriaceae bacterium]
MSSTPAQKYVCPRCRASFDEPGRFCAACGADMNRASPLEAARRGAELRASEPAITGAPDPAGTTGASGAGTAELTAANGAAAPTTGGTGTLDRLGDRRLTDSNRTWLGKVVDGRYRVLEVIGRGGMGVVYRVEHMRMGKIAAMKVLHRDLAQDPEVVQRFEREAAAISKLHHPHTVQVFDFGNAQGALYLIMEYVRGLDLARIISRDGPIPWPRCAPLLAQICGALQEAHELGIVHRDLKPENVLITRTTGGRDYAKVLDFGLAKLDPRMAPNQETERNAIVGTPYFMAPEQIRGDEVDARSDLYSFGALMFELLTGEHLYTATTAVGVLTKHLTAEPDAPSIRAPRQAIPPAVDQVCKKALARDPRARWRTAAELAEAIEEIYGETVHDTTGGGSRPGSRALAGGRLVLEPEDGTSDLRLRRSDIDAYERGLKRQRMLVLGGTGVLAAAAIAGGAVVLTRDTPPLREEREPNDEAGQANRIAAGTPITGFIGKRHSPTEPDRDVYVVPWPPGTRHVVTVAVSALPNIDLVLSVSDGDGLHGATVDEAGPGGGEVLHRRAVDGPVVITIGEMLGADQKFPVENVSDPYTLTVSEEASPGEVEPNNLEADANPLILTEELRGTLDTRLDVDLLRWTGEAGSYHIVVRGDGVPLVWRLPDGKARTPGAAEIELHKGDLIRLERTDRSGSGPLAGRDGLWSVVVTR